MSQNQPPNRIEVEQPALNAGDAVDVEPQRLGTLDTTKPWHNRSPVPHQSWRTYQSTIDRAQNTDDNSDIDSSSNLEPNSSSDQQKSSWRSLRTINESNDSAHQTHWRDAQLSKEEQESRESERRSKMEERTARRKKRAEDARQSWVMFKNKQTHIENSACRHKPLTFWVKYREFKPICLKSSN